MIKKISIRILYIIAGLASAWIIAAGVPWLFINSSINVDIVSGILSVLLVIGVLLFIKNKDIKYYFLVGFIVASLFFIYLLLTFHTITD